MVCLADDSAARGLLPRLPPGSYLTPAAPRTCPATPPAAAPRPPPHRRMEDFNRERQLYGQAISPQFVPMMYFSEVRCSAGQGGAGRGGADGAQWHICCCAVLLQKAGRQSGPADPPPCRPAPLPPRPCPRHPCPPPSQEGSEDLPPYVITERGDFTLGEVLTKSRPPPQQQKILLHDVACALAQLHGMGLVQMDIRPANIMFFRCGAGGGCCDGWGGSGWCVCVAGVLGV